MAANRAWAEGGKMTLFQQYYAGSIFAIGLLSPRFLFRDGDRKYPDSIKEYYREAA